MNNQEEQIKVNIASPWARLVAYLIDVLILVIIFGLILFSIVSSTEIEVLLNNLLKYLIFLILFFSIALPLINCLLICKAGGTLGKLLTGTRIIDEKGLNLSFLRAFFRNYIGYTVSSIFLWLGFIWILKDKERRAWHDLITGSWVIVKNKFGLVIGLLVLVFLLVFNIFLGQTAYQRFRQNQSFFYGTFNDIINEFKTEMEKESDFQEQPSEPYKLEEIVSLEPLRVN